MTSMFQEKEGAEPILRMITPDQKEYKIWMSGKSEGFPENTMIINGPLMLLRETQFLAKICLDNGLITIEQGSRFLP